MITIEQLLESVNYQIEPKWVTKDKDGTICIFGCDKPKIARNSDFWAREEPCITIHHIKLADFENKDWQECIYEVPRKTTGKIEKLPEFDRTEASIFHAERLYSVVNELVDAVNQLKVKFELPTLNPNLTDEDLRKMMRDPKYWRDGDSATIQKVQNGFNKLYGDKN